MDGNACAPWSQRLQRLEYGWYLPWIARLPLFSGYFLARARGRFNAFLDRDWASLSLGRHYIRAQTSQAYSSFLDAGEAASCLKERFETLAREEYEVWLVKNGRLDDLLVETSDALERLSERRPGRGLVLVTAHFDSFFLGVIALGRLGLKINVMTSNIVEDTRVHPSVRNHFSMKYRVWESFLNGGKVVHAETSLRYFYEALGKGEIVVIVTDGPATNDSGVWMPWFGKERRIAGGALRMAVRTGSDIGALICRFEGNGRHRLILAHPEDPSLSHEESYRSMFSFLESHILEHPGRWWGAHLLPSCEARES